MYVLRHRGLLDQILRNFPNQFELNADGMTAQCPTFHTVTLLCEKMQYFASMYSAVCSYF